MANIFKGACVAAAVLAPSAAWACGGLFCNNSSPVVQQYEHVIFAVDGDMTHMHVRIQYQGPPQDFGWLLPVPRGVETKLSGEGIFQQFERFGPEFLLNYEQTVQCVESPETGFPAYDAGVFAADASQPPEPPVEVISREPVGPYDRAILDARTVEDLRNWLNENGYQIPDSVDDRLRPYVDAGAVFVAIKLLAGETSGAIVPLELTFPGNSPTIPLIPTAVAASPDMGIVVELLGSGRGLPVNYRHVRINEATLDWFNYPIGGNYFDVVAAASDEAGGQAFTTDFAGPHALQAGDFALVFPQILDAIRTATDVQSLGTAVCGINLTDPDVARVLRGFVQPPSGDMYTYTDCLGTVGNAADAPVDGAAVAARLETEVNDPRAAIGELLGHEPYLTRLFTTMSPDEMNEDPAFAWNPALPDVSNVHTATLQLYQCREDGAYDRSNVHLVLSTGEVVDVHNGEQPNRILRERGMTVRQGDAPAARRIETLPLTGSLPPEPDMGVPPARDAGQGTGGSGGTGGVPGTGGALGDGSVPGTDALSTDAGPGQTGGGGGGGCGCDLAGPSTPAAPTLLLLAGLGVATGRRRRG